MVGNDEHVQGHAANASGSECPKNPWFRTGGTHDEVVIIIHSLPWPINFGCLSYSSNVAVFNGFFAFPRPDSDALRLDAKPFNLMPPRLRKLICDHFVVVTGKEVLGTERRHQICFKRVLFLMFFGVFRSKQRNKYEICIYQKNPTNWFNVDTLLIKSWNIERETNSRQEHPLLHYCREPLPWLDWPSLLDLLIFSLLMITSCAAQGTSNTWNSAAASKYSPVAVPNKPGFSWDITSQLFSGKKQNSPRTDWLYLPSTQVAGPLHLLCTDCYPKKTIRFHLCHFCCCSRQGQTRAQARR